MQVHPLAEAYPLMPEAELQVIIESMKEKGFDPRLPIVKFKGKILDGRNRYNAAVRAKVKPVYINFNGTLEEAEEFVKKANEDRRHLTAEWLTQKREERIARVAEARQEGQSLRTIAEKEGVSVATVHADVEAAHCSGVNSEPESGKITGKDGREQAATRPGKPPKKLCDRCQNLEPGITIKGCPACKDLNRPAKKKVSPEANGHVEQEAPLDAFQNVIPKKRRDAYGDPWVQDTIDFLGRFTGQFLERKLSAAMRKRAGKMPFFNVQDFTDGCGFVTSYLDDLLKHLKDNRLAAVCPMCEGKGCGSCRLAGMVPRSLYADLKKEAREKAKADKEAAAT